MEDLQHALGKRGLTVTTLSDKGRCLFTTRDFSPGDVIISQEPYVCVPNESRCDGCFSSSNLKKCSACQVVWYCGNACQKSDWKLHRLECHALSKLDKDRKKSLTPSIRLMVKLCVRRKLQSEKLRSGGGFGGSYPYTFWISNVVHFACNAHTICDSELQPLGTGLYPVISVINHSCAPNSVLMFEGKVAVVRAVQHIPRGSEVLISYIETAGSTMTRKKALKEQYFFTCTCPRCIKMGQYDDIRESAILEGYRCRDNGCSGFLLRVSEDETFICQQCGFVRYKEEMKKIASEVKPMMDKASTALSSGNYIEARAMYKIIERLQMKMCHPFSLNLLRTRETIVKILMELQDWREALSYCRLTIPVYQRVYPGFHPLLGLQHYTCGKLEWLLGLTEDAVKSLTNAVDILRVTHGTNTHFVKELLIKLEEARAEVGYSLSLKDE
ncbi:histone-lysine N-methyltransferase ASHR1 isoform X2 [Malania oleifera]|uniref:histone-lysine N-methyltransferase ASHR1 isoform X2 n=1 Tax=Malania oleifera TaxID=397392 RepID=UPI0025AE1F28|nr:histone-lysine N-methyltransferase ASHR1 isoform X2 [Malania oleifera]